MIMLMLNHFFMNGWLPAICVFSQIQFLIQVDRLLVFLKYAKILLFAFTVSQRKCSMKLGTGLKKLTFSEYRIFHQWKLNRRRQRVVNYALNFNLWMMRDRLQTGLLNANIGKFTDICITFQHKCHTCSAWVYWELWCQAPNQTVMQVGHMLFFFLEQ